MKRLVSTIGLPKEEWLKYRKQGIWYWHMPEPEEEVDEE